MHRRGEAERAEGSRICACVPLVGASLSGNSERRIPRVARRGNGTVAKRFTHVRRADSVLSLEVGDRACNFQNTVVSPRRQGKPIGGSVKQSAGVGAYGRMRIHPAAAREGVARYAPHSGKTSPLQLTSTLHPRADDSRAVPTWSSTQLAQWYGAYRDVHVDSISQWTRETGGITVDIAGGATAPRG